MIQIRQEITKTNEVIKATTDIEPEWFAPPSGSYRDEVVKIASEEKMRTIMWSVDTIDWQKPTPDVLSIGLCEKFIMVLLYLCIQHFQQSNP